MLPLKEIISVCVRAKKKHERFFFSRKTYTRIIVIDLIIVKLFEICPVVFHVNICIFVYDCYFGLLIFVIILFGT